MKPTFIASETVTLFSANDFNPLLSICVYFIGLLPIPAVKDSENSGREASLMKKPWRMQTVRSNANVHFGPFKSHSLNNRITP